MSQRTTSINRAYPRNRKASYNGQNTSQDFWIQRPHWAQKQQRHPQYPARGYYNPNFGYDSRPRWSFKEDTLRKNEDSNTGYFEDLSTVASGNGSANETSMLKGFQIKVQGVTVLDKIEAAGPIFDEKFAACSKLLPPEPQEIAPPRFL